MNDNTTVINEEELKKGAREFSLFYLRPKTRAGNEAIVRLRINGRWGGWKLKDELVRSLDCEVGDTITNEVTVLFDSGLIEDADDTDLFATSTGADWLLENNVSEGSIIDCKVRFVYTPAPVGGLEGRRIMKLSLVFIEGYNVVEKGDFRQRSKRRYMMPSE